MSRIWVWIATTLLFASSVEALRVSTKPVMDNKKCKIVCQRFGMRSLGVQFNQIRNPTECCQKCDEVFSKQNSITMVQEALPPHSKSASMQPIASSAPQHVVPINGAGKSKR
eukprot:TRINITY_DN1825_c0_g1_i1.p1 TRINITY_DN1825_c0_g1~~TRINITY_DN1825_c0_g1_i1.p1  ORF type:complete len:112 (-),score=19.66 TRINITY_DN1825_c0_g1_i1:53-388(-)